MKQNLTRILPNLYLLAKISLTLFNLLELYKAGLHKGVWLLLNGKKDKKCAQCFVMTQMTF